MINKRSESIFATRSLGIIRVTEMQRKGKLLESYILLSFVIIAESSRSKINYTDGYTSQYYPVWAGLYRVTSFYPLYKYESWIFFTNVIWLTQVFTAITTYH